jgi:hypothetical protein
MNYRFPYKGILYVEGYLIKMIIGLNNPLNALEKIIQNLIERR